MIDVHCHLLPGVDDGCRDLDESIETARLMAGAGVTEAICTPHVQPRMPQNNVRDVARGVARLQRALDAAGVPLRVHPGGENRCGPENATRPTRELVLAAGGDSRGGPLGRRFFLFDDWGPPPARRDGTDVRTAAAGRHHADFGPPRADAVDLGRPNRHRRIGWRNSACCCSSTATSWPASATGRRSTSRRRWSRRPRRLLEAGRYDFLATDTHRPDGWPPRRLGLEVARDRLGDREFHRLAVDNPRQLLPAAPDAR